MTHMTDSMINHILMRGDYQPAQQTRGKTNNDTRQENDIQPRTGGFNKPTCMIIIIIIIITIICEKFVVKKFCLTKNDNSFFKGENIYKFHGYRASHLRKFFPRNGHFLPCNP